jgi:hypothetical protein
VAPVWLTPLVERPVLPIPLELRFPLTPSPELPPPIDPGVTFNELAEVPVAGVVPEVALVPLAPVTP